MNTPLTLLPDRPRPSHWPVDVTHYDRSPDLNETERAELERLMSRKPFQLHPSSKLLLHRLLLPLEEVFAVTHLHPHICGQTSRVMLMEMYHRGKTFWAWSDEEWREIIGSSTSTFAQRYGRTYGTHQQHPARRELVVLTYLLCSPINIDPLLGPFAIAPIARKVWGAEILDAHVKLLTAVLRKWG